MKNITQIFRILTVWVFEKMEWMKTVVEKKTDAYGVIDNQISH